MHRDLPPVPRPFIATGLLLLIALVAARAQFLDGLGGYGRPTLINSWNNFVNGLKGVFWLVPADRPWQPLASAYAIALPLAALACWTRASAASRFVMLAGLMLALLFNLPFIFVSKPEQMHLVGAGAALLLTGCVAATFEACVSSVARVFAAICLAVGIAALAYVSRHISTDFEPFGPIVLANDRIVRTWGAVPDEVKQYLERKEAAIGEHRMSANPLDELRSVGFGFHPVERSSGIPTRWMAHRRVAFYVAPPAREISIPVRHEIHAFGHLAQVTISVDGEVVDAFEIRDSAWRTLRYPFRKATVRPFSRMHRVWIGIQNTWRPSQTLPGSSDPRHLGLIVGEIQVR